MKPKISSYFLLILSWLIFSQACITVAPRRFNDDGSEREEVQLNRETLYEKDGFEIRHMDERGLRERVATSDTTWVILWAPWCAHCVLDVKTGFYPKEAERLGIRMENILFISTNYDYPSIHKFIGRSPYPASSYVLDSRIYGSDESKKIQAFCEALAPGEYRGVPQHFFFCEGKLLHHSAGKPDFGHHKEK